MCSGAGEIVAVMLGEEDIAGMPQLSTLAKRRIKAKKAKTTWQPWHIILLILITYPHHCRSPAAPLPIRGN